MASFNRVILLGKSVETSGTDAKGADVEFDIFGEDGAATGIRRTANCKFNAYTRGKMALIWRQNGRLVANQIECGT